MFDTGACWVLEFVFICNVIHMNSAFQVLHWSFGLSKYRGCLSKYWGRCLFCWLGGQPTEVSAGTRQSVRRPIGNPHTTLCTNISQRFGYLIPVLYLHTICVWEAINQNWRDNWSTRLADLKVMPALPASQVVLQHTPLIVLLPISLPSFFSRWLSFARFLFCFLNVWKARVEVDVLALAAGLRCNTSL